MTESCHSAHHHKTPWYKRKLVLASIVFLAMLAISLHWPPLTPFYHSFILYLEKIWWALCLGLFIGGIIDYAIPREIISFYLGSKHKRTILTSVLFGFLMSVCSHGILAIAMEIYKKGASTSSVIAFLLASPWANVPFTLLLIGFFGLKAVFFILGAVGIAIITGLIFQYFEHKTWIESNPLHMGSGRDTSLKESIHQVAWSNRFRGKSVQDHAQGVGRGILSLADMVVWWILIGAGLAALASAYFPEHLFQTYMGPNLFGLLITLAVATVMEVCSEGTAPLAFELYRQTGAFGNAFVFLMAGVVTDYTEIGLLWQNIGKKTAILLPIVTVPQVIVLGIIANRIF